MCHLSYLLTGTAPKKASVSCTVTTEAASQQVSLLFLKCRNVSLLHECVLPLLAFCFQGALCQFYEHKEKIILLKCLLLKRHLFKGKNHSDAFVEVDKEVARMGITSNIILIEKAKRNLMNLYRVKVHQQDLSWPYYVPCAVLKGDKDEEALTTVPEFSLTGEADPKSVFTNKLETYPKGTRSRQRSVMVGLSVWNANGSFFFN